MKNKKVIGIIVLVVIIIAVLAVIATNDLRQTSKLRKEVAKITSMDITKDEIDMKIKTKGKYAIVEEAIKTYLNDYSGYCKAVGEILEDEKIAKILTAENYRNDRPDFNESKAYVTASKLNFNEKMNSLISMTNEEAIMNQINDKGLDEKFINLYKELMLDEETIKELKDTSDSLQEASDQINKLFDIQERVIDLLVSNKGKWIVNENDEIQFESQSLANRYNKILEEM